jgi:hypothetical protein
LVPFRSAKRKPRKTIIYVRQSPNTKAIRKNWRKAGSPAVKAPSRCNTALLDPPVVADLLGPQPALTRRRGARNNALRLVAALAIGAVLVLLGLVFVGDPPDHDLYGRTGKVEVRNP